MQKLTALILLAAGSFALGGSSNLCFAEGIQKTDAATPAQTSQQKMQKPSQRKMHRMQKTGRDRPFKSDSAAMSAGGAEPKPSQRSMRQKLREAKQKKPAANVPEAR